MTALEKNSPIFTKKFSLFASRKSFKEIEKLEGQAMVYTQDES